MTGSKKSLEVETLSLRRNQGGTRGVCAGERGRGSLCLGLRLRCTLKRRPVCAESGGGRRGQPTGRRAARERASEGPEGGGPEGGREARR